MIAVAGDDHVAKSSTAAHQSDHIFKACGLPVFFPATVQEILDLGIHAFAMSRFCRRVGGHEDDPGDRRVRRHGDDRSASACEIRIPTDFQMPPGGLHIRWPDAALEQEARLFDYKWYAALAYIRANRLNYNVIEGPQRPLRHHRQRQGLQRHAPGAARPGPGRRRPAAQLGIRLHKVGVVWPLEAQGTREFAQGLREILVVEEKRQVIEYQLKEELYNWRPDVRPNVVGKFDEGEGDYSGGEWSHAQPDGATRCCAPMPTCRRR